LSASLVLFINLWGEKHKIAAPFSLLFVSPLSGEMEVLMTDKPLKIIHSEDKDTAYIVNYINNKDRYEKNDCDYEYTYINEYLQFEEYYSSINIRSRKSNLTEEYVFLESNGETCGIITFSLNYGSPVLDLNLIKIRSKYLKELKNHFLEIVDVVIENTIIVPTKIRASLMEGKQINDIWLDLFKELSFVHEAKRKHGIDFQQNCSDYILNLV